MFTLIILAAAIQAPGAAQRVELVACLKESQKSAQTEKVAADAFDAYLKQKCGSVEAGLKNALVAFDVKNKISRKQASSDAQAEIDDYFGTALERYKATIGSQ